MQDLGKFLVIIGLIILGVGILLGSGLGRTWLGQLPGDFRIERENFRLLLPITSCLLISLVLSALAWLLRR